jgi:hypothetical protein
VCRPFNSVSGATGAVAPGGVIQIVPGATADSSMIGRNKPLKLVAPIGGVTIGTVMSGSILNGLAPRNYVPAAKYCGHSTTFGRQSMQWM